ncbi:MAG: UDP-N-acetylmuramoyl-L-alanyl-D-glutamate--2,6-diaminopimelate ligase, partial [Myxococcales bacterium]|nr:UDP-N-acetylmuramoyl-L-alanyl-D-glutamate--2,6-diaminopimelate ligase [Myxococcales bacterium]
AFNGENALAALAVGVAAGCDFHAAVEALHHYKGAPGRVQRLVHAGTKAVFIDYAHSPDAFEKVLGTVRAAIEHERAGARLVTMFGCGGDRDRGKRPLMLAIALRFSDRVIVTTDNPRSEDPRAVVEEMLAGAPSAAERERVTIELDRSRAIHLALDSTGDSDIVMLLGKGHEDYQLVGNERLHHSDYAVAAAKLAGTGST